MTPHRPKAVRIGRTATEHPFESSACSSVKTAPGVPEAATSDRATPPNEAISLRSGVYGTRISGFDTSSAICATTTLRSTRGLLYFIEPPGAAASVLLVDGVDASSIRSAACDGRDRTRTASAGWHSVARSASTRTIHGDDHTRGRPDRHGADRVPRAGDRARLRRAARLTADRRHLGTDDRLRNRKSRGTAPTPGHPAVWHA